MEAVIKVGKKTFAKNDFVKVITKSKKIYFGKITCIFDITSGGNPHFVILPKILTDDIYIEFADVESINKYKKDAVTK